MPKATILAISLAAAALLFMQPALGQSPTEFDHREQDEGFSLELRQAIAEGAGIALSEVDSFVDAQREHIDLAEDLTAKFPHTVSGIWQDAFQQVHVSATNQAVLDYALNEMPSVRTHLVKYSREQLEQIQEQVTSHLSKMDAGDGSYVGIDEEANRVAVAYAPSKGSSVQQFSVEQFIDHLGSSPDYQQVDLYDVIEFKDPDPIVEYAGCENGWDCFPYLRGGMFIQVAGRKNCTAGFAARNRKGEKYILTAGHCGRNGSVVKTGRGLNTPVGIMTNSSNNVSTDSARIFVSDRAWKLSRWVRMDASRQAVKILGRLGQSSVGNTVICKSGMATGLTCGKVTKKNYDVWVDNVLHKGFWQANFGSNKGDSGGPVFVPYNSSKNASQAYGIVSGSQGSSHTVGPGIFNVENAQNVQIITD